MADYLVVTGDNPSLVQIVEGKKNVSQVIDALELEDGDKATIYRIGSVSNVKVVEETKRRVVKE